MKYLYFILAILGAVIPFTEFFSFVNEYGVNSSLFLQQAFGKSISAFAWLDVIITAVVVVVMICHFKKMFGVKHSWIPIVASFLVGPSFGLPLFLFMRELKR